MTSMFRVIRKTASLALAVLLAASLAGCSRRATSGTTTTTVTGGTSSAAPSATNAPEDSPRPTENTETDGNGTVNTYEHADDASRPALSALSGLRDTLRELYGDVYYPDTELSEAEIRRELDLDDSLYEEIFAENTAEKAHPDTFIAVRAKDGKAKEVEQKLRAYKQKLLDDKDYSAFADKIDAAEIYTEGDYVFFVLLGDVEDAESGSNLGEAFGNEIRRGVDAIRDAIGLA